jgi:hypothetical protein
MAPPATLVKADDAAFTDWRFEQINTSTNLPSSDENYPLEWKFNTSETEYLDPRIFLKLEVKITNADGTAIENRIEREPDMSKPEIEDPASTTTPKAKIRPIKERTIRTNVGPINYLLMTMFKHVDIQINGQSVMLPHSCFSWLAYLNANLHFNEMSKNTALQASYFMSDTVDMECSDVENESSNHGFYY